MYPKSSTKMIISCTFPIHTACYINWTNPVFRSMSPSRKEPVGITF